MIKKILRIIGLLGILWIVGFFVLVRLGKLNVKGQNSKTIFGYDKINNEFVINGYKQYNLDGKDGVYVLEKEQQYELLKVIEKNEQYILESDLIDKDSIITFYCEVENSSNDQFKVKYYRDHFNPIPSKHNIDSKIIAISDIEGNFNAFCSFLQANKVIDSDFNWIFGDGHLVLVGDFMDRGKNVTQCLWLIYKLEHQAKKHNGVVHFIVGNHEAMNLQGSLNYLSTKYRALIQQFTNEKNYVDGYKKFLNVEFVLGNWLKQKNIVEKINNTLFVHGGISPEVVSKRLTIPEINGIARENIDKNLYGKTEGDSIANLIMGREGPLWYRGMVTDYKDYYKKMNPTEFNEILEFYQVDQIVIGHTIVEDIALDYNDGLIKIDVRHGQEKESGDTKGILIDGDYIYKINDINQKEVIKTQ